VPVSGDAVEVEAVVIRAMHAEQELAILPASVATSGVTQSMRDGMVARARSTLAAIYVGRILDARLETMIPDIEGEGTTDGIFQWDGGVRDVEFRAVDVDGDQATVIARATSFVVISPTVTSERSSPSNRGEYAFLLSRLRDAWYITAEDHQFLPGQGP
jgi:hypothetical protein